MSRFTFVFTRAHSNRPRISRRWLTAALAVGLIGGLFVEVPAAIGATTAVSPASLPGLPVAKQAAPRAPWVAPKVEPGLGDRPWENYTPVARGPEDTDARSKYAAVYANADGTRTVSLSSNPVHFQDEAKDWKLIDSTVIADPDNAGGFRSKANSWVARFAADGLHATIADEVLVMTPKNGAASTPSLDAKGRVVYADVWPGVDVRYTVTSSGVEQDFVVRQLGASPTFSFDVTGVKLSPDDGPGAALHTANDSVVVGDPVVQDKSGKPVDAANPSVTADDSSEPAVDPAAVPAADPAAENRADVPVENSAGAPAAEGQVAPAPTDGQQVDVVVDPVWWDSLQASDLPITVDPTYDFYPDPDMIAAYQSGGASAGDLQIGNPSSGSSNYWRTVLHFPYEEHYGAHVLSSSLGFERYFGTLNQYAVNVFAASAWSYAGAAGAPIVSGLFGDTGTINDPALTAALDGWVFGKQSVAVGITGLESSGTQSWKEGEATLNLTLDQPAAPAVPIGPADGTVVSSTTPTLAVLPSKDPENSAVTYRFRVGTTADATGGAVYDSGWTSANAVTLPNNIAWKDGTTYAWRADTQDATGLTSPNVVVSHFRFDRRLGDDPTQSYDAQGPVKVDLATGNLVTGVSTPTIATVAGPAGVRLSYNSFAESRAASDTGVPQGWRLEAGAGVGYTNARVDATTGSVVLVDGSGVTHEYKKDTANNSFTAPIGELGVLASIDAGGYTLSDADGTTYVFDAAGALKSAVTAADDKKPAALVYAYSGSLLSTVTDPVRNATVVTLAYGGGTCPTTFPPGFDTSYASSNLCQVTLLDGRVTKIFYTNGRLARVENPGADVNGIGADVTDFGYDANGNMIQVRDSMQADWVAAGVPPSSRDTDYARTLIDYDTSAVNAKVTRVRLAAPDGTSATAALRPDRTFTYRASSQTAGFYAYGSTDPRGVDVAVGELNSGSSGAEIVTGTDSGAAPDLKVFSKTGTYLSGFSAYASTMTAGIRVAVGDVDPNSPGNEIITGTNAGAAPQVAVFSNTGVYRGGFYAYDSASTVGTDVAVGDLDADGVREIVTSAASGGPHVKTFHFSGGSGSGGGTGTEVTGFMAYDVTFLGGVRVTTMDADGDGRDEIVTAPGLNGGALVRLWAYPSLAMVTEGYLIDPPYSGGIDVAGASGRSGLVVGTLSTEAAMVLPQDGSFVSLPYGPSFTSGLRVAMGDLDGDGALDIVTGPGPGAGPHVRTFSPSGVTDVAVAGLTPPSGYAHRVVFDGALRTVEDRDAAARATYTQWAPSSDKVLSTTDAAGRRSTTIYDANDRPTAQYGPAPAAWFQGSGAPSAGYTSQVAATTTTYDTNPNGTPILGLAAAYWDNETFTGPPTLHGTGDGDDVIGDLYRDWSTGSPGSNIAADTWSARYTGTFTLANTETYYQFNVHVDDGVRIWVDGKKILDSWSAGVKDLTSSQFYNAAGQTHSIRVDYQELTGGATITLSADDVNDGSGPAAIHDMKPNYGLPTSSTVVDGGTTSPSITTTTSYADALSGIGPELGVPTATTVAGLTTSTVYETPGVGYLRRTKRTLPAGNYTNYANYAAADSVAPPAACGGGTAVLQGGLAKSSTSPSSTNITETAVYDKAGRPIASTVSAGSLTSCITYDTRGRIATRDDPSRWPRPGPHRHLRVRGRDRRLHDHRRRRSRHHHHEGGPPWPRHVLHRRVGQHDHDYL